MTNRRPNPLLVQLTIYKVASPVETAINSYRLIHEFRHFGIFIQHFPLKGRKDELDGAWRIWRTVLFSYFRDKPREHGLCNKPREPEIDLNGIGAFEQVARALLLHSLISFAPPHLKHLDTPHRALRRIRRNVPLRYLYFFDRFRLVKTRRTQRQFQFLGRRSHNAIPTDTEIFLLLHHDISIHRNKTRRTGFPNRFCG